MIEMPAYSPRVLKTLFFGRQVSPYLDFSIKGLKNSDVAVSAMERISVSGVQEKFPAVIDGGKIRLAREGERSTHILKPAPWDETIAILKIGERRRCANQLYSGV